MQIRIVKHLEGVYPELQPEVGATYTARPGKPRSGSDFCIAEIAGKHIVIREGEYEILRRDPEDDQKQPPLWRGKEKHMEYIKQELPEAEAPKKELPKEEKTAPKKRGPKPKAKETPKKEPENMLPRETERAMERQQIADLQEIIHDLRLGLAEETTKRYKAERALLRLTVEKYGGE